MPMLGATAPATFGGTLAQGNAEVLSGLVIHQLRNPGAPFIYGSISTIMDMQTTVCSYGAPEMDLMTAAMTDLAHSYGLPMYGLACCTDSPAVDQQAAVEAAVSAMMSLLSGANMVHDVGLANHCTVVGPTMLVLSDEIIEMVKRACQPIPLDEEALALDVIDRVGPGGNYLLDKHTLAYYKNIWYSDLFLRDSKVSNESEKVETFSMRLQAKVKRILDTHQPIALPEEVMEELVSMEKHWLS
jgi:trimethylamine--corrinoid protein Co-methyltransferase